MKNKLGIYYEIWPMDELNIRRLCLLTNLNFKKLNSEIERKYHEGIMLRPGDGLFYLRNTLNTALRELGFNIRMS